MKQRVLTSVAHLSQDALPVKCLEIRDGMLNNDWFPNPVPAIPAYSDFIADYQAKLQAAASGSKLAIAEKNESLDLLVFQTKKLGNYVNSVAEGNVPALVSSGFTLAGLPQPRIIDAPTGFVVLQGKTPGSLISKVKRVKGANGYEHKITPNPLTESSVWTTVAGGPCKATFDGLEEGQLYWLQVVALGSRQQRTYSDTISAFVAQRTLNMGK